MTRTQFLLQFKKRQLGCLLKGKSVYILKIPPLPIYSRCIVNIPSNTSLFCENNKGCKNMTEEIEIVNNSDRKGCKQ